MAHLHSVYDTDSHFSIDKITRAIKNESSKKVTVMQFDHNSERFTFDLPRYIEGHDMSVCNLSEVHYQNGSTKGVYVIDDLQISPADNDVVICSWLISRNATQNAAALDFRLTFSCVSEEGKNEYEWNTGVHKGISVQGGIRNSEVIEEEYSDAIGYLNEKMNTAILCNEAIEKVDRKVDTLREEVSKFRSNIVETASGDVIAVTDSSDMELAGLKVFGKTTQNGTPTPEAPVPLESVGDDGSVMVSVGVSETDENPQTITVSTPNGLPGIPVAAGGNYTDENGQQWACDEVNLAKNVYVQNIGREVWNGTEAWTYVNKYGNMFYFRRELGNPLTGNDNKPGVVMSDLFKEAQGTDNTIEHIRIHGTQGYAMLFIDSSRLAGSSVANLKAWLADHNVTFLYRMGQPTVRELTEAEKADYTALHTNYPNTTVFNDGGADMEVQYVADTKRYIDKKFDQLAQAMLNQ